ALHAYCSGQSKKRDSPWGLIFPFGLNESQLLAVERAFSSQISVIEGPPGTGKTQTILNVVANILIQNKTVAILSNNNSA
ncbi:AAA family ATPase, partial [Escherichia coli]|nr:AAA family ATPase [Escherichia coli]